MISPSSPPSRTLSVLLEMRPALDGFFGIPQQNRSLFALLARSTGLRVNGLLQLSNRVIQGGLPAGRRLTPARATALQSQAVISIKGASTRSGWRGLAMLPAMLWVKASIYAAALCPGFRCKLRSFPARHFEDFLWESLFARSVSAADRTHVTGCDYKILSQPWRWMNLTGAWLSRILPRLAYPKIDMRGVDVFIAQTPYPGRLRTGTTLVVQYHDAIPIFLPHTISDRSLHNRFHFYALQQNVHDGAWFVCVSEATRADLLSAFPAAKSITIPNIIAPCFAPAAPAPTLVPNIILQSLFDPAQLSKYQRSKLGPRQLTKSFANGEEKRSFYHGYFGVGTRYILLVSTLEPRKNHIRLIEAWQSMRQRTKSDVRLILVGNIGWEFEAILDRCMPHIESGELVLLRGVPGEQLCQLYRNAIATICPSVQEGFDYSGIESMRSGGVVAASDIPVHREIYGDAAFYFDPYDPDDIANALQALLHDPQAETLRETLRNAGEAQSRLYMPDAILPKWQAFLSGLPRSG
ncbi:glycosyltransferase family 4 protein [Acidocella facilis]|uniref:glycosyltransferase family 4 protein n=1 Tax=Acidocella facilis TaxID=525 RepID=UPI001F3397C6|nr:glycosyltransferase family 1 protein [Acidocella facilis]